MSRIFNTVKKLGLVTYPFGGGQMKYGAELSPNLVINSVKPILHKMKLNLTLIKTLINIRMFITR